MKKILALLVCSLFVLPSFATVVGSVDLQKVIVTVKESKKQRKIFEKEVTKKQKLIKKDEATFAQAQKAFQKQSLVMNAKAQDKKKRELAQMYTKFQKRAQSFNREMQAREQKIMKPILDKVRKIVEAVAKKAKVDLVFEKRSAGVLFAKTEKDLTQDVIKAYDKKYPSK
jgi:outer membrane protein